MAEVTGNIGGQQVELNNAATEATLRQLLAAMMAMGKAQGLNTKFQKDYEKELKKLLEASKKQIGNVKKQNQEDQKQLDLSKKNNAALDAARKKREEEVKALQDTIDVLRTLASAVEGAVGGLTTFVSNMANMGNSMTAAASAMSQIPLVGGLLSGVFGAVAGAAEKSYKAFQQSASVGANFGGSINAMIDSATGAGMTIENFTGLIAKNSDNLRYFGGTVGEGARRMADLGKQIRSKEFKNLNDDLARLGYSTEDINEGFGHYGMLLAKQGKLEGLSNKELVASTGEYLKQLDAVSRLTGKSKEALMAEEKQRQNDAQFRMLQNKVGKTGAANLNLLMNRMGPEMGKAFQAYASTGTAFNEQAKSLAVSNPRAAAAMEKFHRQLKESGTVTSAMMNELDQELIAAGKGLKESTTANALATYQTDKFGAQIVDSMNYGEQSKTIQQAINEQQKGLADQRAKAEKGVIEGMDPAAMKRFSESLAEFSNQMTKMLGENFGKFQEAFITIANFITGPAMTAFTTLMDHLGLVVGTLVTLKVAATAFGVALKIKQMKEATRGVRGKPMYVTSDDGLGFPDKDGPDGKKGPKGPGGKGASKAMGLLKGLGKGALKVIPGVGLGIAAYEGISAGMNAEETLGIKDRKATTGEKVAAGAGGILSGLTLGMVGADTIGNSLAKFFGAGPDKEQTAGIEKIKELEAQLAKDKEALNHAANEKIKQGLKERILLTQELITKQKEAAMGIPSAQPVPATTKAQATPATTKAQATPATTKAQATPATTKASSSYTFSEAKFAQSNREEYEKYEKRKTELMKEMTEGKRGPSRKMAIAKAREQAQKEFMEQAVKSGAATTAATVTPAAASVQSTLTKEAEDTKNKSVETTTKMAAAPKMEEAQEKPTDVFASLNSNMIQLVNLTRQNTRILERQLKAQQNMSSDVYAS